MSEQAPKYGGEREPSWLRDDERERVAAYEAVERWDIPQREVRAMTAMELLEERLIEARRELADERAENARLRAELEEMR